MRAILRSLVRSRGRRRVADSGRLPEGCSPCLAGLVRRSSREQHGRRHALNRGRKSARQSKKPGHRQPQRAQARPTSKVTQRGKRERTEKAQQRWLVPAPVLPRRTRTSRLRLLQLQTLLASFTERLEQEKLESLAEFAAGAGHEINNPLAVISGRAQLFLRHEKDPERRRELAVINTQARRVHEMIADLMLFARPPEPRLATCDVVAATRRGHWRA